MYFHVCASLVFVFVDVESEGVHAQPQLCALLVFDLKVVDTVHLQVLGNFKILHHRVLPKEEQIQRGGIFINNQERDNENKKGK